MNPTIQNPIQIEKNGGVFRVLGIIILLISITSQSYLYFFGDFNQISIGYLQREQVAIYEKIYLLLIATGVLGLFLLRSKQKIISIFLLISLLVGSKFFFAYKDATFWNPLNNVIVLFGLFFTTQLISSIRVYNINKTSLWKIIIKNIFYNILFFIVLGIVSNLLDCSINYCGPIY